MTKNNGNFQTFFCVAKVRETCTELADNRERSQYGKWWGTRMAICTCWHPINRSLSSIPCLKIPCTAHKDVNHLTSNTQPRTISVSLKLPGKMVPSNLQVVTRPPESVQVHVTLVVPGLKVSPGIGLHAAIISPSSWSPQRGRSHWSVLRPLLLRRPTATCVSGHTGTVGGMFTLIEKFKQEYIICGKGFNQIQNAGNK